LSSIQPFNTAALSKLPSFRPLALLGWRHTQVLFEQLKVPGAQSETLAHCLQVLLTQAGVPPPQEPHVYVPPQPFGTVPQFLPLHAVVCEIGTHWHVEGVPWHSSLFAQAVQREGSAQPLLESVVTHLSPHFLVPEPHDPTTQVPAWQTSVPAPGSGQDESSQLDSPQP
jgi:hypothetical protein